MSNLNEQVQRQVDQARQNGQSGFDRAPITAVRRSTATRWIPRPTASDGKAALAREPPFFVAGDARCLSLATHVLTADFPAPSSTYLRKHPNRTRLTSV